LCALSAPLCKVIARTAVQDMVLALQTTNVLATTVQMVNLPGLRTTAPYGHALSKLYAFDSISSFRLSSCIICAETTRCFANTGHLLGSLLRQEPTRHIQKQSARTKESVTVRLASATVSEITKALRASARVVLTIVPVVASVTRKSNLLLRLAKHTLHPGTPLRVLDVYAIRATVVQTVPSKNALLDQIFSWAMATRRGVIARGVVFATIQQVFANVSQVTLVPSVSTRPFWANPRSQNERRPKYEVQNQTTWIL